MYNWIWNRVCNIVKEGFDSEPMYNEKYLKTKGNSYDGKINTNFDGGAKQGSHCVCLLVIVIDFVFKMFKNYYPQLFLEVFKYIVKENKISKFINKETEISSDALREKCPNAYFFLVRIFPYSD